MQVGGTVSAVPRGILRRSLAAQMPSNVASSVLQVGTHHSQVAMSVHDVHVVNISQMWARPLVQPARRGDITAKSVAERLIAAVNLAVVDNGLRRAAQWRAQIALWENTSRFAVKRRASCASVLAQ